MPANGGKRRALAVSTFVALFIPAVAIAQTGLPLVDPSVPAGRDTEPVILTGDSFPGWSVPANATANLPAKDLASCPAIEREDCAHNHYEQPEVDTSSAQPGGTPTDQLLGYRWNADDERFEQIPFQVDEVFTRYLNNDASNFAIYSGSDQHTTYAYDREGFRFTANDPSDPCHAVPALDPASNDPEPGGEPTTPDPVGGLDNNDELVFMASDAGPAAPVDATLPEGVEGAQTVVVTDPLTGAQSYAYVMKAAADGPAPAFDADNGYVDYERDADADTFHYSESDFEGYGNAPKGPYCDSEGNPSTAHGAEAERRPGDEGTISTDRYRFRYDGRWLMTDVRIAPDDDGDYGGDLVDRWKARAFAQDPSSHTPCCGFEEEDTNWGGSSQLLGELSGPVRAIRETWGADSGTNVIRRESFYRDEMRQKTWLRVHVIPPLDGIYAQWDFNAGAVDRYYNPHVPNGVPVDGKNDEALGNLDDPCNPRYDSANNPNNTSEIDQMYRSAYREFQLCDMTEYHQSIDLTDPTTVGGPGAALDWNQTSGPEGTIVDRISIDKITDLTPGGVAQSVAALPYYRDDSCFDDGTGSDPGVRINPGAATDQQTYEGQPRRCWDSATDGSVPGGDPRYFQGDIGAHGLHLMFQFESDNARLGVPIDEIVSQWRMVMLPGQRDGSAGEVYGRGFEKPLLATVAPSTQRNRSPHAEFGFDPPTPESGQDVDFDASASTDPDGSIEDYAWDLDGDGIFETDGGSDPRLTRAFARPGSYQVGLLVTDASGGTGTVSHEVQVSNRGPTAAISFSPQSPTTEDEVLFDGSTSADPDGSIGRYEWDLDGDGSFETDTGTDASVERTFDTAGGHEVGLRVTDDSGATGEATTQVQVSEPPPAPDPGAGPVPQGNSNPSPPASGGGATPRAVGFRLALRRSGRARLSYSARLPVEAVLNLKLVGVRDGSKRALARRQLTAERTGDVALTGRIKRAARRCRGYDACRLVAHAAVTSVATQLYGKTRRIRLK